MAITAIFQIRRRNLEMRGSKLPLTINAEDTAMITPLRTESLSERELYLFDTTGLLKIPRFLGPEDIQRFCDAIFSCPSRVMGRGDKVRYDNLTHHSALLDEFARSRSVKACVEPLINQPLRLIESYCQSRKKDTVFYLHNGLSEHVAYGDRSRVRRDMRFTHTYHDGKLYCMYVKCLVYLSDVTTDEDGAFCYIQGSHKANFPWFSGTIDESDKPALTRENFPTLMTMHVAAGDVVLLNEALLHGSLPKTNGKDRLFAAFSYGPWFIADWPPEPADYGNVETSGGAISGQSSLICEGKVVSTKAELTATT
jgi:hypothetical protein